MSARTLPPSPRRRLLARKAGLVAQAPALTTAAAWAGASLALLVTAPQHAALLRAHWRAALGALDGPVGAAQLVDAARAALGLAAPLVLGAALAALLVHLAQVRTLWSPRRRVPGAPELPASPAWALGRAAAALARAAVLTAVAVWFTFHIAGALATLWHTGADALAPAAALFARALLALCAAWAALGLVDLLGRLAVLAYAMRMTHDEARRELTEHGAAALASRRRKSAAEVELGAALHTLAGATALIVGDEHAAAVRWEPRLAPEPLLTMTRRGVAVSYALALARRAGVPVVRAPALARQLVEHAAMGKPTAPVPAAARQPLAALLAHLTHRR